MVTGVWFVVPSFVLVLVSLFLKDQHEKISKSSVLILTAFAILVLGLIFSDSSLRQAVCFGVIVAICQLVIADPYLVDKTLIYRKRGRLFMDTPWWMAVLWGVAMTHLAYGFFMLAPLSPVKRYLLFVVGGSVYFYVFEFIASNHSVWWERRRCWQPQGVAFYATVAEVLSVLALPLVFHLRSYGGPPSIIIGLMGGAVISLLFIISCRISYRE